MLAVLFCLITDGTLRAQGFPHLKCVGEMPDDFRLRYTEKYETTLDSLSGKGRKKKKTKREFAALTTIAIDNMFRSGKVLYGDEISLYCSAVLDSLLVSDPELRKQLRVYTLRSNEVNAYSTHQGVILISTGLMARLESEAQLAFILAHEIAHYVKKHNLQAFEYNKELFREDIRNTHVSIDRKLLASASYSREAEIEADAYGWELYAKSGYPPYEVIKTYDLLLFAYLPPAMIMFPYGLVEDDSFRIRSDAKEFTRNEIMAAENVDDTKSTHPNNFKRKRILFDKLQDTVIRSQLKFKLEKKVFDRVVELARREVIYNHLISNEYVETIGLCDAWLDAGILDPKILNLARAMSYYGLQVYTSERKLEDLTPKVKLQGDQKSYFHLLHSVMPSELQVLACREIWKIQQADTSDPMLKAIMEQSIRELVMNKEFRSSYRNEILEPETESESSCFTCRQAFKGNSFLVLDSLVNEGLAAKGTVTKDKGGRKEKKKAEEMKELEIQRMLVLSPRYFGIDVRKPITRQFLRADEKQLYLEDVTGEIAREMGIEVVIPDSREQRQSLTDDFNNYVAMLDWMEEGLALMEKPRYSLLTQDMHEIKKFYSVDYLTFTMYLNLIERREFNETAFATVFFFAPYLLPVYLYWQFVTPNSYMMYSFVLLNLDSGQVDFLDQKFMNTRYRDYLVKAHLYNSLNQIRK